MSKKDITSSRSFTSWTLTEVEMAVISMVECGFLLFWRAMIIH